MMTLESAVIIPIFFLIVFVSVGIATDMYETIDASSKDIEENEKIDAVKNFRYINIGEDIVSFSGGSNLW